jgi:hypothetical protein
MLAYVEEEEEEEEVTCMLQVKKWCGSRRY